MDSLRNVLPVFAAIFLGLIPTVALLVHSRIRSRKKARLELKRHVREMEAPWNTWN
jgi:hypothetical protein